jgi:hypothetical protein
MKRLLALGGALLLSLICETADAQVAREAFYSIPSETISAADFLTGKKGTPVALAGQLRLAKTGSAKQPAVVLLHSASGPIAEGAPYEEWPRVLNEIGIATFAVDSYTGRYSFLPIQARSRPSRWQGLSMLSARLRYSPKTRGSTPRES